MENKLEYILSLKDQISGKLTKIGITNDQQLDKWAKVEKQINSASNTMKNCGGSIGSLNERISALRAEKEWIPAKNINAIRRSNIEIRKLEKEVQKLESLNGGKLKKWFSDLKSSIPMIGMLANPLVMLSGALYKTSQYVKAAKAEWLQEAEAQHKLGAVMRNTMGATQEQIKSILDLASAQQKLGVVGDEVQIAGSQELSTYLQKTSSLKKLLPVMNDMLAQQYGFNATQEQATNIAMMMGKVMDGQVGALSRYGYKFTEAQEKILKFGTEEQRAATLANVISSAVGGVNEALAQTPEGKLKQHANTMRDLKERVGSLYTKMQIAFLPLFEKIGGYFENLINWFEANQESVRSFMETISNLVLKAFNRIAILIGIVIKVVGGVTRIFNFLWEKLKEGNIWISLIAVAIGSLAVSMALLTLKAKALAFWKGIVTSATLLWAAAQNTLNLSLLACPLTWYIAIGVALVALIAYLALTTTGWGETWRNVMTYIKLSFSQVGAWLELKWLQIQNVFLNGFELIQKGWYKLQSLWDEEAANVGLQKIQNDRDKRVEEIAKAKDKIDELSKVRSEMKLWEVRNNGKSLSEVTKGLKEKIGLGTNAQLEGSVNAGGKADGGTGGALSEGSQSISAGGSRSTNITISMKDLVGSIVFNGYVGENKKRLTDEVLEALIRVVNMGQSTVG